MSAVSILIVNFNGARYIQNLVQQLNDVVTVEKEILIFDNCSTDGSLEIINSLANDSSSNVTLISEGKNIGFGAANNKLAERARFNNLLLINNDVSIISLAQTSEILGKQINIPEDIIYTCKLLNADMTVQRNIFTFLSLPKLFIELFYLKPFFLRLKRSILGKKKQEDKVTAKSYFSGCFLLLSKKLFQQIGGFDVQFTFYHEEMDFFKRAGDVKKIQLDDAIIHYGGGGKSLSDFAFKNYYIGLYKYFKKYKPGNIFIKQAFLLSFWFRTQTTLLGLTPVILNPVGDLYKSNNDSRSKRQIALLYKELMDDLKKE